MFGISKSSAIIAVLLVMFSESVCCPEILSELPLPDGRVIRTVFNWNTYFNITPIETLICVISGPARLPVDKRDDISGESELRIYKASEKAVEKIYEQIVGKNFLYAYPIRGRLLTVFGSAGAFDVMIFDYIDNKVKLLLKTEVSGIRGVFYDDDGNEMLIVSDRHSSGKTGKNSASGNIRICKWNGKQYEKFGPFSEKIRFDIIKHFVRGKKIPKKWRSPEYKSLPSSR